MRTLWIKAGGFLPLDSGGKIRSYHTVKNLARRWPTTVLTFYPEDDRDENDKLRESVEKLIKIPLPRRASALIYSSAVLHDRPFMFEKFCRPQVTRAVENELGSGSYELVICDFLVACGVVPVDISVPKIVFTHNVENRIWERHYNVAPNLLRRMIAKREWQSLAKYERKYLAEASGVLAVSDADCREFTSWGIEPVKARSVPTGVDTEFFAPRAKSSSSAPTLVFTGSMDWMPNQDGILWFLSDIFPLIREKIPEVRLFIVGRKPPAKIIEACGRQTGVTVTGWVEDVRDYLCEADVCIVPLRVGSGTRLKIFEAMAMGKATVSTSIGAEGLPVKHGEEIILADDPSHFAAACVELLQNAAQRDSLGTAARCLVQSRYSWPAVTEKFIETIETALGSCRTTVRT